MLVDGVVADARGRDRGEEHVLGRRGRRGGLEVFEIAAHGGMAAIGNRRRAGMAGRADGAARKFRRHEFRKTMAVAAEPHRLIERIRPRLESAQPLQAVVRPAGFAELAVIDHVDAGLRLPRDDVGHRACERALMRVAVRRIRIARGVEQRLGADQAANVRRENTVLAAFHVATLHDLAASREGKNERGLRRGAPEAASLTPSHCARWSGGEPDKG